MTLYDYILFAIADKHPEYTDLSFLKDDDKSALFINDLVKSDDIVSSYSNNEKENLVAEKRARHSAVSYLIGLALFDSCMFGDKISSAFENQNYGIKSESLWMYTSLEHDYGYYVQPKKMEVNSVEEYLNSFKLNLFSDFVFSSMIDGYHIYEKIPIMAFSYEEIIAYFKMKYEIMPREEELLDHGILGGIKLYNRRMSRLKNYSETFHVLIKIICLTIAQHNIFKSDEEKDDTYREYGLDRITSDSGFRIGYDTPLLLFLSLIDTVECVKKFCKGNNKESKEYLETFTVLKNVQFSVDSSNRTIIWDVSNLYRYIVGNSKKGLLETYNGYRNGLLSLGIWTVINVMEEKENVFSISY